MNSFLRDKIKFLFCVLLLIPVLAYLFFKHIFFDAKEIQNSSAPSLGVFEKLIEEKDEKILEAYSEEILDLKRISSKSDLRLGLIRTSFVTMNNLRNHLNKDNLRKRIMNELLQDSENLKLASKILIDNSFAKQFLGQDQALARVYSIQLLRHAADEGDVNPLFETARELTEILSIKKSVGQGELRDLEDLLCNVVQVQGSTIILHDLESFLKNLSYVSHVPEIKNAFRNALYFGFSGELEDAHLSSVLARLKNL